MKTKDFVSLGKRLLRGLPGFAIKGPMMFLRPVEHTLRGFCFDSHSYEAKFFYVEMFFLPLCVPAKHIHFTFGGRLSFEQSDRWNTDLPDLETALSAAMQKEVPFLGALQTPKDVAEALSARMGKSPNPHVHEAIAYALARAGETTAAKDELDNLLNLSSSTVAWQRDIASRAEFLKAKLLENPADALRQLETWEKETAKNLGLEMFR